MRYNSISSFKQGVIEECSRIRNSQYVKLSASYNGGWVEEHPDFYYTYAKVVSVTDPSTLFLPISYTPGTVALEFSDGRIIKLNLAFKNNSMSRVNGTIHQYDSMWEVVGNINDYSSCFLGIQRHMGDKAARFIPSSLDTAGRIYTITPLNNVEAMQGLQEFAKDRKAAEERRNSLREKARKEQEERARKQAAEEAAKRAAEEAAVRQANSMSAADFENLFRGNQTQSSTSSNTQGNTKSSVDATVDALAKSMGPDVFAAMFGGKKPQGK